MDTLKEERWQRDKREFERRAAELGADVIVQVANGDDKVQVEQCENMLTRGVDVLVVAPHNGEVAASVVEAAHRQGVPVVSYDRLIRNSDVDLYVSFDNMRVGEMQARYLLERAPKGNYVLVEGSPSDNNARLYREGHVKVLRAAVERGDVKIVAEQWAREWLASEALRYTEDALTRTGNDVVAVVAANDGTASGVISAIESRGLTGKILVSGQDAELPAVQRVVEGKQTMTVYKPIPALARRAAEAAVALARREKVESSTTVNNGRRDVPSILLDPVVVDKGNVAETVIKDGYHKLEDVYRNVPRERWPTAQAKTAGGGN
ncbi:MAG: D-xylose ABC transporter substrate-binding protein [Acidobacteria bacterium]|nr:D-xylose ABC transporter substrate-binding protein [Acidobacteriota bacterium]MCA1641666.1 D-xylose ABC transporter substrate-binding protein [Acidobacteriota bacterium]